MAERAVSDQEVLPLRVDDLLDLGVAHWGLRIGRHLRLRDGRACDEHNSANCGAAPRRERGCKYDRNRGGVPHRGQLGSDIPSQVGVNLLVDQASAVLHERSDAGVG